jgi:WD40 repeat protein
MRRRAALALALAFSSPGIGFGQKVSEETKLAVPMKANWFGLSRNGHVAVAICEDHQFRVWSLPDRRLLHTIDIGPGEVGISVLSDDGATAVVTDYEGGVRVVDTARGEVRMQKVWPYPVSAAFSPDGKLLALAPANEPVQIIDIGSWRKRYELQRTTGGNAALAFSSDGTRIAAGDSDTVVRVFDARNGELLSRYTDFLLVPLGVDFTPDGKRVAAGGGDKVVAFVDAATGNSPYKTERQADAVYHLKFSPDGLHLAVGLINTASMSKPAPVLVYESSGRKVLDWNPPTVAIGGGWTADGRLLIGTSTEDAVVIWRVW